MPGSDTLCGFHVDKSSSKPWLLCPPFVGHIFVTGSAQLDRQSVFGPRMNKLSTLAPAAASDVGLSLLTSDDRSFPGVSHVDTTLSD